MRRAVLDVAQELLRQRKFYKVITILENNEESYEGNFDFYWTFGTACLYVGDIGTAAKYYEKAREVKMTSTKLLLGQAAIFLRRGSTERAVQYYLEVLDNDPQNALAKDALEFIRSHGDYSTIQKWVETDRIRRFYPPLGINPLHVRNCILAGLALGCLISLAIVLWPKKIDYVHGQRRDLSAIELTGEESSNGLVPDLSGLVVRYILDSKEISASYQNAMMYFQDHRDNAAIVEINRILKSNASSSIKHKASLLLSYLEVPTFDSLTDNWTYQQVMEDLELYENAYVSWAGRIADAAYTQDNQWKCQLLVGYQDMKKVEGIVPVVFKNPPQPEIDGEKSVRILAQIVLKGDSFELSGLAVYQPLKGKSLP